MAKHLSKTPAMRALEAARVPFELHPRALRPAAERARDLGKKRVTLCEPKVAERHTGYQVGGTSPFGTRRALPVYVERSILELERVYIHGGRRGARGRGRD